MPLSALIAVAVAILFAAALIAVMMSSSRPESGWKASATDILRRDETGERPGIFTEAREVAHADGVSISAILDEAEEASGYYAVPKRYEDRIEAVAVAVANRVDKVRQRPDRTARDAT